jgi:hypothetical protein
VPHRDLTADRLAMRIRARQSACPHTRAVPVDTLTGGRWHKMLTDPGWACLAGHTAVTLAPAPAGPRCQMPAASWPPAPATGPPRALDLRRPAQIVLAADLRACSRGWYYQTPVTDPRAPGLTFLGRPPLPRPAARGHRRGPVQAAWLRWQGHHPLRGVPGPRRLRPGAGLDPRQQRRSAEIWHYRDRLGATEAIKAAKDDVPRLLAAVEIALAPHHLVDSARNAVVCAICRETWPCTVRLAISRELLGSEEGSDAS